MNRIRNRYLLLVIVAAIGIYSLTEYFNAPLIGTKTSPAAGSAKFTPAAFSPVWEPIELSNDGQDYRQSEHVVSYRIQVQLNEAEHRLTGRQWITWRNPGNQEVKEVYVHLYPNAFRTKETTFMQESGGKLRQDEMKENSFGQMQLLSISAADDKKLAAAEYVRPDDGNEHDYTLMKIELAEPVMPGEQLKLHMEFQVDMPYVFARMGYADDFIMAGQWFPKLAAYETAGTRGREKDGWNKHQYHGNSEFYANFGKYDVEINVPASYEVAATGTLIDQSVLTLTSKHASDERKTVRYVAEDVHDFAWSASPRFEKAEMTYSDSNVSDVVIQLYLQPEHLPLTERYFRAAASSLKYYSAWFGPYPYDTLSIVVPPAGASGAGGMEYPTLVTAWAADKKDPGYELEQVIVHEIGHQYFYGLVASNEFEEAWLDEAFTSFAEDKVMKLEYGLMVPMALEASYVTSPQPLTLNAWEYDSHDVYAENVYIRGKLVLKAIEQEIGSAQMMKVLRQYVEQWKYRHPSTADFVQVLEEVTERDWSSFIHQYVHGGMMVDYAIDRIEMKEEESEDGKAYVSEIHLSRHGGSGFEVPLVLQFEDGHQTKTVWDGEAEKKVFRVTYTSPLKWAAIDPDHQLILENRRMNNFMHATVDDQTKKRLSINAARIADLILNIFVW